MEFKRILTGKNFLILLVVLLAFNIWFFIYRNSQSNTDFRYYGELYHETLKDFEGISPEEGLTKCREYEQNATKQMIENTWVNSTENLCKLQIMRQLEEQFSHILEYGDYISGIQKSAESLKSVSLFSKPGSFAYENTVKTAKDFSALLDTTVTMGHDLAVSKVFSDSWMDILLLLPVFLVCTLFISERKDGIYQIIYAAPAGRKKLAIKHVAILFSASFISVILLLGSKILLYGYVYHGLDEWGRSLQSIPMFYNVPTPMTVGEFWLSYLIFKVFGVFLCGLVLWFILSAVSDIPIALCVTGIVVGIEFAMTAIPSSSAFAFFRYVNLMSYINYIQVFTRYLNIPFFGSILSGNETVALLLPFLCLFFITLNIIISERKYPVGKKSRLNIFIEGLKCKLDFALCGGGALLREFKKLLIYRKGIFLFIILAFLLTELGVPVREESPIDMYLQFYEEKYAGPISESTIQGLRNELSNADESQRIAAINQLIIRAETSAEGGWILQTAPYEALFTPQKYHYSTGLYALLFLVLLIAPIMSQERQAEMGILLKTTPRGRLWLLLRKQTVIIFCTTFVWLLIYGTELFNIIRFYGDLSCLEAPCSSLIKLPVSSLNMTVGSLLMLLYFLRLAVLLCVSEICFCLSCFCRKNSEALILCCAVILIPASLAAIGSYAGRSISLLLPLTAVDILPNLCPYIIIFALPLAIILFQRALLRYLR